MGESTDKRALLRIDTARWFQENNMAEVTLFYFYLRTWASAADDLRIASDRIVFGEKAEKPELYAAPGEIFLARHTGSEKDKDKMFYSVWRVQQNGQLEARMHTSMMRYEYEAIHQHTITKSTDELPADLRRHQQSVLILHNHAQDLARQAMLQHLKGIRHG